MSYTIIQHQNTVYSTKIIETFFGETISNFLSKVHNISSTNTYLFHKLNIYFPQKVVDIFVTYTVFGYCTQRQPCASLTSIKNKMCHPVFRCLLLCFNGHVCYQHSFISNFNRLYTVYSRVYQGD